MCVCRSSATRADAPRRPGAQEKARIEREIEEKRQHYHGLVEPGTLVTMESFAGTRAAVQ
jgi:hypothetical protein